MSYEVKFRTRDQASVTIDNEKGEKLKALWFDENQRNTPVEIAGNAYVIGDIKSITFTADPKIELPDFDQTALLEGKKCKAQYSINREILSMMKGLGGKVSEYNPKGKPWPKLATDPKWWQSMRDKLHAMPGVAWCDNKTGECACD